MKGSIKHLVLVFGYYFPYSDLSLAKTERIDLIGAVYWPILGDSRNWKDPVDISGWRNRKKYPKIFRDYIEQKTYEYFFDTNLWYDKKIKRDTAPVFADMDILEKKRLSDERVTLHSRMIKYKKTFVENEQIMKELKAICVKRDIKMSIVIAPFSRCYLEGIRPIFKENMLAFVNDTGIQNRIVDFNDIVSYGDDCFKDPDHLNDKGAERFTEDLNKYLIHSNFAHPKQALY